MPATAAPAASIYRCSLEATPRCDRGNGKPTRKRCSACGGSFVVLSGTWATFVHSSLSGSARYCIDEAQATFRTEAQAEACRAEADPAGVRLVVRFVSN